MINFYLPDFYGNCPLICFLSDLMKNIPNWFYEDAQISAAYGCFPNAIWNGGRVSYGRITKAEMEKVLSELNGRGIAARYTFTNHLIEEKHLNDTFCNLLLDVANNGKNDIIINSPILEKYIRENYPNYRLISSTTKCLDKDTLLNEELSKDYYLVVLDSALNNTEEMMSIKQKDKIEIIPAHACQDNCPNRRTHYTATAQAQLTFSENSFPPCKHTARTFFQYMENRSFISVEKIYGEYKEAGFCHYKLDGRSWTKSKLLESLMYYLVKPEHKDMVRQIILKEIYHI